MTSIPHRRYLSLDIIRGLAATSVLLTHWYGWTAAAGSEFLEGLLSIYTRAFDVTFWASEGLHAGVVVFIVLSGFCIHLPVAKRPERTESNGFWKHYGLRRFIRIYPMFASALVMGAVAGFIAAHYQSLAPTFISSEVSFTNVMSSLLLVAAVLPVAPPAGNQILDTVMVECVLYAAYPVLLGLKRRTGWTATILVGLGAYGVAMLAVMTGVDPMWASRSFYAFLIYWLIGAWAVDRFFNGKLPPLRWMVVLSVLGFMVYVATSHAIHFSGSHYFKNLLLACWTALMLLTALQWERRRQVATGPVMKAIAGFGERSYSLYAVHVPVIAVVLIALASSNFTDSTVVRIATLAVVFIVTFATYHYVERPSQQLANRFR